MTSTSLAQMGIEYYQLSSKDLNQIILKNMQGTSMLTILEDWLENESTLFGYESRERLMVSLSLVIQLMQEIGNLLPETH